MDDTKVSLDHLEQELLRLLNKGLVLCGDILFFAESTCGLSPGEIEAALKDPRFEERDELLALIFTPDAAMRTALEPLLQAEPALSRAQVEALVSSMSPKVTALRLLVPGLIRFDLPVERGDLDYLVSKLYLDRPIDRKLVATLNEYLSREKALSCRVILRCRNATYSVEKRDFLCSFIEKGRSHDDLFIHLFTLVVSLLAEINDDASIEKYFLGRRRQLIKTLREIKDFEQKRDHYSMEYLMMQRYPVPHESEEQILNQLFMVRTITEAILGLPPDPSFQADFRNLGTYGRRNDISNIIRVLS